MVSKLIFSDATTPEISKEETKRVTVDIPKSLINKLEMYSALQEILSGHKIKRRMFPARLLTAFLRDTGPSDRVKHTWDVATFKDLSEGQRKNFIETLKEKGVTGKIIDDEYESHRTMMEYCKILRPYF